MKRVTDIIGEIASASQEQGAGIDPARSTKPIDQRSAVAHDAALLEEF
jgi:methyl-accepting chemotaxis protein